MIAPVRFLVFVGLVLTSAAALAHHSNAAYDLEHLQTMEGTVKTVNWSSMPSAISWTLVPDCRFVTVISMASLPDVRGR